LVPTNSTRPPSATTWRMKPAASWYRGSVFSRLMMWIRLRSPKMKGAIFGFQKRVWCPKWTPASSICLMDTPDIHTPVGLGLRAALPAIPAGTCLREHPTGSEMVARVDCVAKKGRALYHVFLAKTTPYTNPAPLMPVSIKTPEEQDKTRTAGRLAGDVLDMIAEHVQPGITTGELDRICHTFIVDVQRTVPA